MPIIIPHNDKYKKKCLGCVMIHYDCMLYRGFEEYIKKCPCLRCLVKITCTFDDVCDDYSNFMDMLHRNPKLKKRIEQYETRSNIDYPMQTK